MCLALQKRFKSPFLIYMYTVMNQNQFTVICIIFCLFLVAEQLIERIWQLVCCSSGPRFYFSRLTLRLKVIECNSFPPLEVLVEVVVRVVFVGVGEGLDEGDSCSILLPAVPGAEPEPFSRSFRWRLNRPMPGRYISMLGRSYKNTQKSKFKELFTYCRSSREEHRLRVCENKVLREYMDLTVRK